MSFVADSDTASEVEPSRYNRNQCILKQWKYIQQVSSKSNKISKINIKKTTHVCASLSSDQGTGRAGSGGGYSYSFQDMLSKPVAYRTSSYQDYNSYKSPKYIVYPSNSQSVEPNGPGSSKNDVAMDRFAPGEAYGGTIYKIMKAKQKGYQYLKPKGKTLRIKSSGYYDFLV